MVSALATNFLETPDGDVLSALMRHGSGEALLFLHGFPDAKEIWLPVIQALPDGVPFLALDLPSFGASSLVSEDRMRLGSIARIVRSGLSRTAFTRFRIVAHDWGVAVAWSLVATWPELFSGMVLANGPHPNGYATCLRTSQAQQDVFRYARVFCEDSASIRLAADRFRILKKGRSFASSAYGGVHDEAGFEALWSGDGRLHAALGIYRQNLQMMSHGSDVESATDKPVSMYWGTNDHSLVREQVEATKPYCNGEFRVHWADGSHWGFIRDAQTMRSLILEQMGWV